MKYIKTTARNAVRKGLVKKGDNIWVQMEVSSTEKGIIEIKRLDFMGMLDSNTRIRIPKPEPKPIDFGVAGRVLKYNSNGDIVMTTGCIQDSELFSAYILESKSTGKGRAYNTWIANIELWTDITDTYKP